MATTSYGGYLAAKNQYYQKPTTTPDQFNQKRTSAPTAGYTATTVNYAGPKNYGDYAAKAGNKQMSDYVAKEYEDPLKLATNAKGETAFDLQRQRVAGDVEAERARREEALKGKLAQAGMQNSGLAFKQSRALARDLSAYSGRQMSDIATQELSAQQAKSERLGQQAFQSTESAAERAESQRQFDSDQALTVALQNDKNAMQALQDGNKMEFDIWAKNNDIDKADADRYYTAYRDERAIEASLNELLAGKDIDEMMKRDTESRQAEAAYYTAAGQAGSLKPEELEALRTSNPTAYNYYQAGAQGKTVKDAEASALLREDSIRAALALFTDPEGNTAAISEFRRIFEKLGWDPKIFEDSGTLSTYMKPNINNSDSSNPAGKKTSAERAAENMNRSR